MNVCYLFLFSTLILGFIEITSPQILDASEVVGDPGPGIHIKNAHPHITRNSFYNHLVPSLALGNAAFLFGALVGPRYFEYFKKAKAKKYAHSPIGWEVPVVPDYKYYHHQHDHDHGHYHNSLSYPYQNYNSGWGWGSSYGYSPYSNYYSY